MLSPQLISQTCLGLHSKRGAGPTHCVDTLDGARREYIVWLGVAEPAFLLLLVTHYATQDITLE